MKSLAILILAQATVSADGGTVQLHKEVGDLAITVFTSPSPLAVGPADVSLLLQNRNGLEPVLDADISLLLNGTPVRPTREQARNKLLYAAPVLFSEPGKWRMDVRVARNGQETDATGILEVAPGRAQAASYWTSLAFPPAIIALFVIRERLIRRKSKG